MNTRRVTVVTVVFFLVGDRLTAESSDLRFKAERGRTVDYFVPRRVKCLPRFGLKAAEMFSLALVNMLQTLRRK